MSIATPLQNFLTDFTAQNNPNTQLLFDQERDRYLVMHNEWRNHNRTHSCAIQLDIIDGQIWIQQNNTEIYVAQELIAPGVAPQDIIFPSIRKLLAAANCQ